MRVAVFRSLRERPGFDVADALSPYSSLYYAQTLPILRALWKRQSNFLASRPTPSRDAVGLEAPRSWFGIRSPAMRTTPWADQEQEAFLLAQRLPMGLLASGSLRRLSQLPPGAPSLSSAQEPEIRTLWDLPTIYYAEILAILRACRKILT